MFVVGVLLYAAIILWSTGCRSRSTVAAIFNGFLLMGLLGLGFGTLNCVILGFWPTWRNIWNVLTKPLFFISGMFYTFESLPAKAQAVLWYNPLIHGVGLMRAGFYSRLRSLLRQPALRARHRPRLLRGRGLPAPAPRSRLLER